MAEFMTIHLDFLTRYLELIEYYKKGFITDVIVRCKKVRSCPYILGCLANNVWRFVYLQC